MTHLKGCQKEDNLLFNCLNQVQLLSLLCIVEFLNTLLLSLKIFLNMEAVLMDVATPSSLTRNPHNLRSRVVQLNNSKSSITVETLLPVMENSCFFPWLQEYLLNDSLLDMHRHEDIYCTIFKVSLIQTIRLLCVHLTVHCRSRRFIYCSQVQLMLMQIMLILIQCSIVPRSHVLVVLDLIRGMLLLLTNPPT